MRQLWDGKGSAEVELMEPRRRWSPTRSSAAGPSPAPTPAPATASRSPPTSGSGKPFDRAIAEFAEAYADQNAKDYQELAAAAEEGRVPVEYEEGR